MLSLSLSSSSRVYSILRAIIIYSLNITLFCSPGMGSAKAESSTQSSPQQVVSSINKCLSVGNAGCVIEQISKEMSAYQHFELNTRLQFEKKIKDTLANTPNIVESIIDRPYGSSVFVNITYLNMPDIQSNAASKYLFVKYVFFRSSKGWDLVRMDFKQSGDFPVPEW